MKIDRDSEALRRDGDESVYFRGELAGRSISMKAYHRDTAPRA